MDVVGVEHPVLHYTYHDTSQGPYVLTESHVGLRTYQGIQLASTLLGSLFIVIYRETRRSRHGCWVLLSVG